MMLTMNLLLMTDNRGGRTHGDAGARRAQRQRVEVCFGKLASSKP